MHEAPLTYRRNALLSASRYFTYLRTFLDTHAPIIFPGLTFFILVLVMNWRLFTTPMIQYGDIAVNSIQVQDAKHLHELLGNYSRWHFHHPGPFFFYLFAAGEVIAYDTFHLVPAPVNAECLAEIAFSVFCLFLTIHIFHVHVRRTLFPALAVLASIVFLYVLDTAIPSSAIVSLWPPYMAIFSFLLLVSSCASVAAGYWKHLPLSAFAGMVMIHAHAAHLLFATGLGIFATLMFVVREYRRQTLRQALRKHRNYICAAIGIIALFCLPILIDAAIHHPSNIDNVRAYLREHHGERNSWKASILYTLSFFTYYVTPEAPLSRPSISLAGIINPNQFVDIYWMIFLMISLFGVIAHAVSANRLSVFIRCVLVETVVVVALFLYWSRRMTGPMYTFNGYFFFAIQLFVLLAFVSLLTNVVPNLRQNLTIALGCALTAPILLVAGVHNSYYPISPDVLPIYASLKTMDIRSLTILTDPQSWPIAVSVASYLKRSNIDFCLAPGEDYSFITKYTCKSMSRPYRVAFSTTPLACNSPCSVIYKSAGICVRGAPYPAFLTVPVTVTSSDNVHRSFGFSGDWTERQSFVRFYISRPANIDGVYQLIVSGTMLPGRPVTVKLNGTVVGAIDTEGRSTETFNIDPRLIIWNGADTVTFEVPNAGPVGADNRTLGFLFDKLQLAASSRSTS